MSGDTSLLKLLILLEKLNAYVFAVGTNETSNVQVPQLFHVHHSQQSL
jgi:hypothetical protein